MFLKFIECLNNLIIFFRISVTAFFGKIIYIKLKRIDLITPIDSSMREWYFNILFVECHFKPSAVFAANGPLLYRLGLNPGFYNYCAVSKTIYSEYFNRFNKA